MLFFEGNCMFGILLIYMILFSVYLFIFYVVLFFNNLDNQLSVFCQCKEVSKII